MRRYRATFSNNEQIYFLATEHHEAAEIAAEEACNQGLELADVVLDNPQVETDHFEGDSLLWL